ITPLLEEARINQNKDTFLLMSFWNAENRIITVDGRSLRIRKSLQQFLEELTPDHFIRVHKKYVVCINHVRFVDTEVTMVVGNPLPIGREYKDDFLSHFRIC
ncbi:LytTR family DNA-binding domain-containing protein, partial [Chitinophaga sp. S165]|uniref:LytTR family DNA-binding domain-containing protein n=1 Tax=Chitinophaga sp. S165 TaxID=2135462 RepID=UPI000D9BC1AB